MVSRAGDLPELNLVSMRIYCIESIDVGGAWSFTKGKVYFDDEEQEEQFSLETFHPMAPSLFFSRLYIHICT